MMHSNRPPTAPQTQRRVSVNPFAAVLQDDDDDNAIPVPTESLKLLIPNTLIDDRKTEEFDQDDDECSQASQSSSNVQRVRPPRPSMAIVTSKKNMSQQQRRRRRSSARFLQLSKATRGSAYIEDREDDDEEEDNGHLSSNSSQKGTLQEMYQTAIRMNAENKINTTNSWNLHIIDQMDALLSLNDGNETSSTHTSKAPDQSTDNVDASTANTTTETSARVNFTKASCTLDASVKIYSYRVDDVHLTSYKVLANLNRTQNNKNDKSTTPTDDNLYHNGDDNEAHNEKSLRKESNKAASGSTLETNIANINLNKLDSAYDIDPLFHKMSKTFDEGGAKGLLLANLGVSESSCRIVFDSSANDVEGLETPVVSIPTLEPKEGDVEKILSRVAEGMMDITSLTEKLKSMLSEYCADDDWDIDSFNGNSSNVRSIPLVPQLSALRIEHEKLVELGCCGPDAATALASTIGPKTPAGKVRKYHANSEQEQDADFSIHKEAIERSHRKLNFSNDDVSISPRNTLFQNDGTDHHSKAFTPANGTSADQDYGGGFGYDDGVDDDDDNCFDAFIANARYSEVSLASTTGRLGTATTASITMLQQPSTFVTNFIDAIASGTTVLSNSDYEYFSSKSGKSNNEWAGAAHWKRDNVNKGQETKSKPKSKAPKKKSTKKKKNRDVNDESLVVFSPSVAPDLSHLLHPTTKRKGNNTLTASTLLSKAMIAKYTDEENVLPHDVGFQNDSCHKNSLYQLTKLFLYPQVSILRPLNQNQLSACNDNNTSTVEPKKMVEFNLPSSTDWDDGNNDGPGFDFGGGENDDDEFVVPLLENVRKVDKVRVGYATVAKKVDVKRLKKDLWSELESHFTDSNIDLSTDMNENETPPYSPTNGTLSKPSEPTVVSFQETVRTLGQEQSQADITLPFYFICILHLANEKGLRLEQGSDDTESSESQQRLLSDFSIYRDEFLTNDIY